MKKILIASIIIAVALTLGNIEGTQAKSETYEEAGMEFVVGEHKPTKRINPKSNNIPVTQIIVVDNEIISQEEEGEEDKPGEEGEVINKERSFATVLREVFDSIAKIIYEFNIFEQRTEGRLDSIEEKLDIKEEEEKFEKDFFKEDTENRLEDIESKLDNKDDEDDNAEKLNDLTEQMIDEIKVQEERIVELEEETEIK